MEIEENWRSAVANVYTVFSNYRRPSSMEAADKHDVPKIMSQLTAAALSELSEDNLGAYAGSAPYTIGTLNDYKHFLPRIIELSIRDTGWPGFDPAAVASTLNYAHVQNWLRKESEAIKDVFIAALKLSRSGSSNAQTASSMLCANAIIGNAITPLLSDWLPLTNANAVIQLANLVRDAAPGLDKKAFWKGVPQTERHILQAWVTSGPVREALLTGQEWVADEDQWEVESALLEF